MLPGECAGGGSENGEIPSHKGRAGGESDLQGEQQLDGIGEGRGSGQAQQAERTEEQEVGEGPGEGEGVAGAGAKAEGGRAGYRALASASPRFQLQILPHLPQKMGEVPWKKGHNHIEMHHHREENEEGSREAFG